MIWERINPDWAGNKAGKLQLCSFGVEEDNSFGDTVECQSAVSLTWHHFDTE